MLTLLFQDKAHNLLETFLDPLSLGNKEPLAPRENFDDFLGENDGEDGRFEHEKPSNAGKKVRDMRGVVSQENLEGRQGHKP